MIIFHFSLFTFNFYLNLYFLAILIALVVSFLAVVGIVNQWVKYRTWHDDQYVVQQIYTRRRLLWLCVKCWIIVVGDVTLLLSVKMDVLMMSLVVLMGLLALMGIVQGESLAEVRLLQSQGENQMLRSQLNPHFLYNTLNNIDALIWLDQEKASAAVTNLSQLMRYFTYSARQDRVAMGEEILHLTQLVELQRLRMPQPDSLTFEVDVDNPKLEIPPLLLLPLMENCFKHCGDLNAPDAIRISISLRKGMLEYRSSNNVKPAEQEGTVPAKHRHGVGLSVLRRRLDLLYDGHYSLLTEKAETRFVTFLQVELVH